MWLIGREVYVCLSSKGKYFSNLLPFIGNITTKEIDRVFILIFL